MHFVSKYYRNTDTASSLQCLSFSRRIFEVAVVKLKLIVAYRPFSGFRQSSVGIATRYGLDGPGTESRCGARFSANRPDRPWGPPSLVYMGTGSFPGVKRPGRGVDHPPHLAPRLKKEYSYTTTPLLGLHDLF